MVLGHVDHGKSSLLEAIREDFRITAKESGGITQHIGAYQAEVDGKKITLLDTPGHEAFSAMRSRGALVADIAILVVAADDGVKPQTKEAIEQAKAAGVPLLVAINKIDTPGANPEKVKGELAQAGVQVESYGGSVPCVLTSANTKQGIKELLEMILLMAEVEELESESEGAAEGVVIESSMDVRRGAVATLLVQQGQLRPGDAVGTPTATGKIRILEDFEGNQVSFAGPSMPVVALGFQEAPHVGEKFQVFSDLPEAESGLQDSPAVQEEAGEQEHQLPIVLRADVTGSLEAVQGILNRIQSEKVALKIIFSGVGSITESDVKMARGAGARIIGFNTKAAAKVSALAEREEVKIETFQVIYELEKRVKELLEGSLEPEIVRVDLGALRVLAVFRTEKSRQIIGGKVIEGEIRKGARIEVERDGEIVGKVRIVSLQQNKKDTGSVQKGNEAGLVIESETRAAQGDILRFFVEEKQEASL